MAATVEVLRGDYLSLKQSGALGVRACYVMGLSLGGMIAVAWAQRYPHDLQGAVLINTSLPGINRFYNRPAVAPSLGHACTATRF